MGVEPGTEEGGEDIFPMPSHCMICDCEKALHDKNGFMCCPGCGASYGSADKKYKVSRDEISECPTCGNEHFRYFTIEWDEDGEPIALGQSWSDEDTAQDVCDYMNEAYELGLKAR